MGKFFTTGYNPVALQKSIHWVTTSISKGQEEREEEGERGEAEGILFNWGAEFISFSNAS